MKGLVKQSAYTAPAASDEEEEKPSNQQQDDYVLRKLLKKTGEVMICRNEYLTIPPLILTGVHSVLHHDRIMQSSKSDYALVEMEADRVAKEAVKALKARRAACMRTGGAAQGVATWTGQVGSGGAPGKPRFGKKKTNSFSEKSTNEVW
jgi:DNA excision repair protein ERCC-6